MVLCDAIHTTVMTNTGKIQHYVIGTIAVSLALGLFFTPAYSESNQDVTDSQAEDNYVELSIDEFPIPRSTYHPQEITITGHVADYLKGNSVFIIIISPDDTEEKLKIHATNKGDFSTILYVTGASQLGTHQVIVQYHDSEIASTSFLVTYN